MDRAVRETNIAPKLVQVGPWLELGAVEECGHFRLKGLADQGSLHQQQQEEEELIELAPFLGELKLKGGSARDRDS